MWWDSERWNGYVRPVTTVAAMAAIVYGFVVGTIASDVFVPFATGIVVWWFKSRDEVKKG